MTIFSTVAVPLTGTTEISLACFNFIGSYRYLSLIYWARMDSTSSLITSMKIASRFVMWRIWVCHTLDPPKQLQRYMRDIHENSRFLTPCLTRAITKLEKDGDFLVLRVLEGAFGWQPVESLG